MKESVKSQRAAQFRALIISELGGCCASCGKKEHLQLDLIVPDGGAHHLLSYPDRQRFYFAAHQLKQVQLLCPGCHTAKTIRDVRAARAERLKKLWLDGAVVDEFSWADAIAAEFCSSA